MGSGRRAGPSLPAAPAATSPGAAPGAAAAQEAAAEAVRETEPCAPRRSRESLRQRRWPIGRPGVAQQARISVRRFGHKIGAGWCWLGRSLRRRLRSSGRRCGLILGHRGPPSVGQAGWLPRGIRVAREPASIDVSAAGLWARLGLWARRLDWELGRPIRSCHICLL